MRSASQKKRASRTCASTVSEATTPETGQVEVRYDGSQATVMDLIRAVRSQGFLAGML